MRVWIMRSQPARAMIAMALLMALVVVSGCGGGGSSSATMSPGAPTPGGPPIGVSDPTQAVNPFLGTAPGGKNFGFSGNGGDVFPGAAYPLGMVQWSPDTPANLPGGYDYRDTLIKGFSLTHFSGRGCTVYQDFPFIPYIGNVTTSPATNGAAYQTSFAHASEAAQPGYYAVQLDQPHVKVELTAAAHSGLGRFTFPATKQATLLIDAGGNVNGTVASAVTIDPAHQLISGFATSPAGCATAHYTVNFVARFDRPFTSFGVWKGGSVQAGALQASGAKTGAYLVFDATAQPIVQAQVGISFTGLNHAQANLDAEQHGFDFAGVRQAAHDAWLAKLSRIMIQGGTNAERIAFYTALYHVYFHPNIYNDVNGDYTGFDGQVHRVAPGHAHYENIPGWDNYRSLIPLRTLLDPAEAADIAQSLVDDAIQGDGHMPRWEQANIDSFGMIGDSSDVNIATISGYGATAFDVHAALNAMAIGQPKVREGLDGYLSQGYVPQSVSGASASMTLEYASDDFAASRFAAALGDTAQAQAYLHRSGNWRKLFNATTGYIQPRQANGDWVPNVALDSQTGFAEGSSAQYTWMVPFDMHGLIASLGGNGAAVQRLDTFFTKLNEGPGSTYAFMGNEPCFDVPWVYDFAGAPSHTQAVIRRIQTTLFKSTPDGLPGNDDAGAMSSWYIFGALGLYPAIPGVPGFAVGSPLFPSATVHLGNSQTLTITGAGAADDHPYVAGLTVNGQPTTALWLPWASLSSGATLAFTQAASPTTWGTAPGDAPPSFPAQG